jgi:hypothetical protein
MANRPQQISRDDFMRFCMGVYELSSTMMEFHEWFEVCGELLQLCFWFPEIDTPLAIQSGAGRHG